MRPQNDDEVKGVSFQVEGLCVSTLILSGIMSVYKVDIRLGHRGGPRLMCLPDSVKSKRTSCFR